ncbi:MAG: response regulator [Lachnospiraceae bacterium]|nr:response regulator [Lachnospiraceae bacterium]
MNIAILAFQTSVIVNGIEKNLSGPDNRVITLTGDFHKTYDLTGDVLVFIVYLPNDIIEDHEKQKILSGAIGEILEAGRAVLFIGEDSFHKDFFEIFSEVNDSIWINRPVDMDTLQKAVEDAADLSAKEDKTKKRILIVDDDPPYAKMVREWLKKDFEVDIVTTGMQAISFLLKIPEGEKIDMILLDYEMPVVDGPQVLQMLRQNADTAQIPVVFLTGVGSREDVARVMELKPEGYVLKSTTRADLLAYLKRKLA